MKQLTRKVAMFKISKKISRYNFPSIFSERKMSGSSGSDNLWLLQSEKVQTEIYLHCGVSPRD